MSELGGEGGDGSGLSTLEPARMVLLAAVCDHPLVPHICIRVENYSEIMPFQDQCITYCTYMYCMYSYSQTSENIPGAVGTVTQSQPKSYTYCTVYLDYNSYKNNLDSTKTFPRQI